MILQAIADHLQTRGLLVTEPTEESPDITISLSTTKMIIGQISMEGDQIRCHRLLTYPRFDEFIHISDPNLLQYIETWCVSTLPTYCQEMLHPLDTAE